jgi:hypothetical protein
MRGPQGIRRVRVVIARAVADDYEWLIVPRLRESEVSSEEP